MSSVQDLENLITYVSHAFPEGVRSNQPVSTEEDAKIRELCKKIIYNDQNQANINSPERPIQFVKREHLPPDVQQIMEKFMSMLPSRYIPIGNRGEWSERDWNSMGMWD